MMVLPKMPRTRILDAGKALADNDLVGQTKEGGVTAYTKVEFIQRYRDKILVAAKNIKKREAIPTKRSVARGSAVVMLKIPKTRNLATLATVDDVESFKAVRKIPHDLGYVKITERKFKDGVA